MKKLLKALQKNYLLVIIIVWGVIVSMSSVLLWRDNQKLKETNNTLSKSNEVLKELVANEYKSYQAINDCFVVQKGLCNPEDFKNKLQTLGDAADEMYDKLSVFNQQLQRMKVSR